MGAEEYVVFVLLFSFTTAGLDKEPDKLYIDHPKSYSLHKSCEVGLHKQIDEEMRSHLIYSIMAAHFDHNSVARKGFSTFFLKKAKEEREHVQKFIDYLNLRGGRFAGFVVKMPTKYIWIDGVEALRDAITLENHVNNKLHFLHNIAALQCEDQHLMDYLENEFFDEKVKSIDELHRHNSVLSGMKDGIGEYLFDQQLLSEKDEL